MIDIRREQIVSLAKAAAWWKQRAGRDKLSPSTMWRWAVVGVLAADGTRIQLETLQDGHRLKTSVEALQRLFERLDVVREQVKAAMHGQPAPRARPAAIGVSDAMAELERLGA